ncbi:hypothetical protein FSC10_09635 [Acinetobacter schindleri]|uniref:Uncharacterized protein n=1 Tax=Acinetobacter schindleri TaxID=108981 RepID=A0AAE7BYT5_9GAMM|nr:hypothetical protein FSC10_09635 [Acinetobacter schindleri]
MTLSQSTSNSTTLSDDVPNAQTDLIAALYGLHFKVKPLILNTALQSSSTSKQLIWVEQSQNMKADEFDVALNKIIQYFEIYPFCTIRIDNEKAEVCISQQHQQSHCHIPTDQIEQYLQENFYNLCLPSAGQAYLVELDAGYMGTLEPQTNLGKFARDLRIKSVLEKMK